MSFYSAHSADGDATPEARAEKAREAIQPWLEPSGEFDDTYIVDFVGDLLHMVGGPEVLGGYMDRASIHYYAERR